MTNEKRDEIIRIDLTAAQRELVKAKTGRDAEVVELTMQELEERITPGIRLPTHNEAMLVEQN
jgi:hypothetical protein